ncbi:hypothetical protein DOTSEDRAFT_31501 [Dothistroma septosporum NZE10]|uniref:Uncharacterized protein n=1 Tax=Dothistroma septosporum (strain NZE10 / CBS 128990) TaxID=675120 RepID=N1PU47_DOTSN|nr:hypothetical protein DOTSEDRAFT_31501 [Dothistroma septosporum NZE10]
MDSFAGNELSFSFEDEQRFEPVDYDNFFASRTQQPPKPRLSRITTDHQASPSYERARLQIPGAANMAELSLCAPTYQQHCPSCLSTSSLGSCAFDHLIILKCRQYTQFQPRYGRLGHQIFPSPFTPTGYVVRPICELENHFTSHSSLHAHHPTTGPPLKRTYDGPGYTTLEQVTAEQDRAARHYDRAQDPELGDDALRTTGFTHNRPPEVTFLAYFMGGDGVAGPKNEAPSASAMESAVTLGLYANSSRQTEIRGSYGATIEIQQVIQLGGLVVPKRTSYTFLGALGICLAPLQAQLIGSRAAENPFTVADDNSGYETLTALGITPFDIIQEWNEDGCSRTGAPSFGGKQLYADLVKSRCTTVQSTGQYPTVRKGKRKAQNTLSEPELLEGGGTKRVKLLDRVRRTQLPADALDPGTLETPTGTTATDKVHPTSQPQATTEEIWREYTHMLSNGMVVDYTNRPFDPQVRPVVPHLRQSGDFPHAVWLDMALEIFKPSRTGILDLLREAARTTSSTM